MESVVGMQMREDKKLAQLFVQPPLSLLSFSNMYSSTGLHGLRGTVAASALSPDPFSYDSIRNCYFANPTSSAMSSPSHFTCSLPPQSLYASSIPLTPHPPGMFYGDPLCHQLTSPSDLPGGCGSLTGWIGGAMPVRKERSRDAARNRRGKENTEFFELAKTLPVSIAITSQLDKASIVRLTIAFLRMRHLSALCSPPWSNSVSVLPHVKDSNPTTNSCLDFSDSIGMHMLQAMDGFVMALYKDGRILYVSETVSVYLGLSQVELTGNHILEYVHQDDHTELCESFQLDYEEFQGDITSIAGSPYRTENNINTASNSYGPENSNARADTKRKLSSYTKLNTASSNNASAAESQRCTSCPCDTSTKFVKVRLRSTLTKRGLRVKSTGYKLLSLQAQPRCKCEEQEKQLQRTGSSAASGKQPLKPLTEPPSLSENNSAKKLRLELVKSKVPSNGDISNVPKNHRDCKNYIASDSNSNSDRDEAEADDSLHKKSKSQKEEKEKKRKERFGLVVMATTLPSTVSCEISIEPYMFVMRLQADFTINFCELRARHFCPVSPEMMTGKSLYDFIHPLDIDAVLCSHKQLLNKHQSEVSLLYRLVFTNHSSANNINNTTSTTWVHSQFSLLTVSALSSPTSNSSNNPSSMHANVSSHLNNTHYKSNNEDTNHKTTSVKFVASTAKNSTAQPNNIILALHYVIANRETNS